MSSARRDSLRPRPERRARPRPRDDAIILYSVGRTIPRRDRAELELLLDQFHADADLQEMCQLSHSNAVRFMTLETLENHDQRYISRIDVPPGTFLAVYWGSLEKTTAGVQDTLCHSMHMGSLVFPYELFVDGTPLPGDCRPGRMQLVNHACAPYHNAELECEEWICSTTGLQAYVLCSSRALPGIRQGTEIRFPYQEVTRKKGVQTYSAKKFWQQAAILRPLKAANNMSSAIAQGWQAPVRTDTDGLRRNPPSYDPYRHPPLHQRLHSHTR
jgi:hypothetical protein